MNPDSVRRDVVMMLVGLLMVVAAAVTMITAEGALPAPIATIGLVFIAIGARRRRRRG